MLSMCPKAQFRLIGQRVQFVQELLLKGNGPGDSRETFDFKPSSLKAEDLKQPTILCNYITTAYTLYIQICYDCELQYDLLG